LQQNSAIYSVLHVLKTSKHIQMKIKINTFASAALLLSGLLVLGSSTVNAQEKTQKSKKHVRVMGMTHNPVNPPLKRAYFSSGFESSILSTAMVERPGKSAALTTPRYTLFFNLGTNMHFNFSKSAGFFVGLGLKNIGFIDKYDVLDSTVISRVYALGIPVGLKFGNMKKGNFLMIGGGVDFPINYKEKGFVKRNDKTKFNEWFSQRTPAVMPYLFAGFRLNPGASVKFQYYPSNFLNPDFSTSVNGAIVKPYAGYNVNLMYVSVAFNIPYRPQTDSK
jgi:hypothetical protein